MSEIKTEIKQNVDGSFTITDAHSTADIVRWLLTQDSKETIMYLLRESLAGAEGERQQSNEQVELVTETMRQMLEVQGQHGNWNYDSYMQGLYNGMEYMVALAEKREPQFRDAPETWLAKYEVKRDNFNSAKPLIEVTHPPVPTAQPKEPEQKNGLHTFHDENGKVVLQLDATADIVMDYSKPSAWDQPQQNLSCKSTQARLAASWGYVKAESLTDEQILNVAKEIEIEFQDEGLAQQVDDILTFARAIEAAHGIKE